MAILVGETLDFVLDGRTIARPHALDYAGIQWRALKTGVDYGVGSAFVWVIQQGTWRGCCVGRPKNENTGTGSSPGCSVSD